MKIIFLDIDGVLSLYNNKPNKRVEIKPGLTIPYVWDEQPCLIFNEILKETGAEIVLSSDWRKSYRLYEMRLILEGNSINGDRLISYTPIDRKLRYASDPLTLGLGRSQEINNWLGLHGTKNWVAIDDLPLMGLEPSRFVKCNPKEGLLENGIKDRIISILNK